MQQQYQTWSSPNYGFPAAKPSGLINSSPPISSSSSSEAVVEMIERMTSENAVVIFSMSTCCMCHAVKRLLCDMGVNPTVYELDELSYGQQVEKALMMRAMVAVPVVFVGGKLVGSIDRVMASHIDGTLVPLLKQAGALWL